MSRLQRALTAVALPLAIAPLAWSAHARAAQAPPPASGSQVVVSSDVHHDTSRPLRTMRPVDNGPQTPHAAVGSSHHDPAAAANPQHPARDTSATGTAANVPATSGNFDGITDIAGVIPPDNDGAAGSTQYVELVNSDLAVYSKSGATLLAPEATNTLWSGFGGGCQTNNDGDGTVLWDTMSQRWVLQQFSVSTTPYLECIAVSTTSDATGSWNRYSFSFSNFPDYPKMGIWPDAYYATFNLFNAAGTAGLGAEICAFNRASMLSGAAAASQCVMATSSGENTILPATMDGTAQPAAGAPEWLVGISPTAANSLAYWRYHVDWTTPANSSLSSATNLAVSAFSEACGGAGTCIPQAGTSQQLDSLGDRLMYRLQYRNFGDHEAMVVTHAITAGSSVGMRWYELRPSGTSLGVFQQGTYAPDATYRWMGSLAMDRSGDMALGYSTSSSSLHPGIAYTGRLVSDAAGTMPQGEATIITGAGSQVPGLGQPGSRWGDYTEMTVDPADDCTFWYVNQYIPTNGNFNWHTRIGSFKFPSCGGTVTNDFSISASPSSLTLTQGQSGTSTISTATTSGSAQTVSLSASGLPSGATASFSPSSVTSGGSSTLTITTASTTPAGSYTVTVTGTGTSVTHTTSIALAVNAASSGGGITNGGFETGNLSGWTPAGTTSVQSSDKQAGTYAARVGGTSPTNGDSSISQTFTVPTGGTGLVFYYNNVCPDSLTYDWATATLKDNTTGTTTTPLAKVCANPSSGWTAVNTAVTAGHSYTLTLVSHDDNYSADPTYTDYDSVAITTGGGGGGNVVVNGGFETGSLSGWTASGASEQVTNVAHTGSYAAYLGLSTPTNGDSTITQTITVPAGSPTLTFWYANKCPDTVTYDWATVQIRNTGGTVLATPLAKTCAATYTWTQVTFNMSAYAGQTVALVFTSHDDNYSADPTYTLYDDISVQ